MTPHGKKRAVTITITGVALVSALVATAPFAMPTARVLDQRWVRTDNFAAYQLRDSLEHLALRQRDSLVHSAQFHTIMSAIETLNKDMRICIRRPEFCPIR